MGLHHASDTESCSHHPVDLEAAVVEHNSEACCMGLGPAAGTTGCIVAGAGVVDTDAVAVADTGSEDTAAE